MSATDGDQQKAEMDRALRQEQQLERSEQSEELRHQGDVDSRIAAVLSRGAPTDD